MLKIKKGDSLVLLQESYALLCACDKQGTSKIYYENYLIYVENTKKVTVLFQKFTNDPTSSHSIPDIEPFIWARATAETIGHALKIYKQKGEAFTEQFNFHDVNFPYLLFLMGKYPDTFHSIEDSTKCKELADQLKQFREFIEQHTTPYHDLNSI